MSLNIHLLLLILGCALVTVVPRVLPFVIVRNVNLPVPVIKWLSYIPICILTALVVESVVANDGHQLTIHWLALAAIVPSFFTALWTKSLLSTVVVGVLSMAVLRFFL